MDEDQQDGADWRQQEELLERRRFEEEQAKLQQGDSSDE